MARCVTGNCGSAASPGRTCFPSYASTYRLEDLRYVLYETNGALTIVREDGRPGE